MPSVAVLLKLTVPEKVFFEVMLSLFDAPVSSAARRSIWPGLAAATLSNASPCAFEISATSAASSIALTADWIAVTAPVSPDVFVPARASVTNCDDVRSTVPFAAAAVASCAAMFANTFPSSAAAPPSATVTIAATCAAARCTSVFPNEIGS